MVNKSGLNLLLLIAFLYLKRLNIYLQKKDNRIIYYSVYLYVYSEKGFPHFSSFLNLEFSSNKFLQMLWKEVMSA